jgi:hypothetical protein
MEEGSGSAIRRSGGLLVVVLPAARDNGWCGFETIMDHAYEVLADMVTDGVIAADERAQMALGVWPRRRRDLLEPFQHGGRYCNLTIGHCETSELADPARADYQRDGNKETLVNRHAGFYRSIFAPTLASWLRRANDAEARAHIQRSARARFEATPDGRANAH